MGRSIEELIQGTRHTIDLSGYKLDDEGARKIARFLSCDKALKKLNLQWNDIWPAGAQAIALALANNSSLESLDMSHNGIGSEGANYIADALRTNTTLKVLMLCDNNIDDFGATHILRALRENTGLHTLEIEGNPIHDSSLKQNIQEILSRNRTKDRTPSQQKVQYPDQDSSTKFANSLAQEKAHSNNLKKANEILTTELNNLKFRAEVQGNVNQNLTMQLNASIQERLALEKQVAILNKQSNVAQNVVDKLDASFKERIALEKQVAALTKQVEREKTRANELAGAANESLNMKGQVLVLTAQLDGLRQTNDFLSKEITMLSGSSAACEKLDLDALSALEEQLDASLRTVRDIRVQRMQRKLEEMQETKKCKVCFERAVEMVLIPCGHQILCQGCGDKVAKCPFCNSYIQNRIRTFDC